MTDKTPIGAYRSATKHGWSACDKDGHTWAVTEEQAQEAETARADRNRKAGKPQS
jgi:hypothetical protein